MNSTIIPEIYTKFQKKVSVYYVYFWNLLHSMKQNLIEI